MLEDSSVPRSILLLILLILCGGFFAGSETAFSYCSHIRIKRRAEEGSAAALRVEKILDSFDIISLITEINSTFDVAVPAEEIIPENFNSAEALWDMIERLRDE